MWPERLTPGDEAAAFVGPDYDLSRRLSCLNFPTCKMAPLLPHMLFGNSFITIHPKLT